MQIINNLEAVSDLGYYYNLDDNYCLYCAQTVKSIDWEFVCTDCYDFVAAGCFALPACWINDLYIEMYGSNDNIYIKKRPLGVPKGAIHNG